MPALYVSDPVHPDVLAELAAIGEVHLGYGLHAVDFNDVRSVVEAVLLRTEIFDAAKISRSPRLKIIARHGVGTDNVDIAAATDASVWVTTTPGSNSRAVGEHVFALMLSLARRTPAAATGTAQGRWSALRSELTGFELHGRTLGLLGFGGIARVVAEIARGFGMRVQVTDPHVDREHISRYGAVQVSLERLVADSDVLSLHVPLTQATRHIIDAAAIARMRPGAVLVNTARGGLVDERALATALERGHLGGAALDVLDGESVDMKDPLPHSTLTAEQIARLDHLLLTPHIAGQTTESLVAAGTTAVVCIRQALAGRVPDNAVNTVSRHPRSTEPA